MMFLQIESESDMRSCYCAAAIIYILTDKRRDTEFLKYVGIKEQKLVTFVRASQNYGGGFGD